MPIYEYVCENCGVKFDRLRNYKDADAPTPCIRCNSNETRRLLSLVNSSSDGRALTNSTSKCGSCSGGSCSSCGH